MKMYQISPASPPNVTRRSRQVDLRNEPAIKARDHPRRGNNEQRTDDDQNNATEQAPGPDRCRERQAFLTTIRNGRWQGRGALRYWWYGPHQAGHRTGPGPVRHAG